MILSKSDVRSMLAHRNLDLVFGTDVLLKNGLTPDESENESQSWGHDRLRAEVIYYCRKHEGLGVYPNNIGRRGIFAMADLLLCKEPHVPLFVECLGSEQAVTNVALRRKRLLSSSEAPLIFFISGFDYERLIGWGGDEKTGWGSGVVVENKKDILHNGVQEPELTTRGTLRKNRRWIPLPTMWSFIRRHFGLPATWKK